VWAAQFHFGTSGVRQNGDRFIESVEHFKVILAPPELYDEDIIMKSVGNGLNGYYDEKLFEGSEEG
jgi:hypothetical protein